MNISEKLDFLMNITNTRNSSLGKALSFDPSYISRIRSGRRGIPKNQPFSRPVAAYFSRNIKDRYQLETLSKMIGDAGVVPLDEEGIEELIYDWLEDDNDKEPSDGNMTGMMDEIGRILEVYDSTRAEMEVTLSSQDITEEAEGKVVPVGIFYGNQGKRDGIKRFLTSLLSQKKPFTLYIYSDEDMSWLYENPAFSREWTGLLISLIKNGSHIQIIHNVNLEFGSTIETLKKWLPLCTMSAIEPYYCPKLRDRISRRSLFIAKGFSALVSNSVGDNTEGMVNFLVRNPEAVAALEAEYHNYLALCRPLMKTYGTDNRDKFMELFLDEKGDQGKIYYGGSAPALWSMPEDIVSAIAKRAGDSSIIDIYKALKQKVHEMLKSGGEITEIIALPAREKLTRNGLAVPLSDMYGSTEYRYTAEEYMRHLRKAQELSNAYKGYRLIATREFPSSIIMMSKIESDTLIAGASAPTTVFHISHQQFSYAFSEYLERIEKDSTNQNDKMLSRYLGGTEN